MKKLRRIHYKGNYNDLVFGKTWNECKKLQDLRMETWHCSENPTASNGFEQKFKFENQAFVLHSINGIEDGEDIFIPVRKKPDSGLMCSYYYEVENMLTGERFTFSGFKKAIDKIQFLPLTMTEEL